MKLTDLNIAGIGACRNVNFSRIAGGLNFVYGDNGSGKSTVRRFVRGVLFGFEQPFRTNFINQNIDGTGQLGVANAQGTFRISRMLQQNAPMEIAGVNGSRATLANGSSALSLNMSPATYDAFFNIDLQNRADQAYRAATQLQTQLGVPTGLSRWTNNADYQSWKSQADARVRQLEILQQELNRVEADRTRAIRELEEFRTTTSTQLQRIEVDIANANRQLEEIRGRINALRTEIQTIDGELALLRNQIENAASTTKYVPAPAAPTGVHSSAMLYERLDEIDNQIGRWRRVQTDIQNQRVRLRDEMVVWNDLTLESQEHPYHRARAILVSLESKVDTVENQARSFEIAPTNPADTARDVMSSCNQMREDLYSLCQELGTQYKHIRHKAAVAELKQLRRCYNEMGDNIDRLISRREKTIAEIRQLDPAGADAIMRAENNFCECAQHEGYLEARRRFIGAIGNVTPTQVDYSIVAPNLTAERQRASELQTRRNQLGSQLNPLESQAKQIESNRASLIARRDSLTVGDESQLRNQIAQWNAKLQSLNEELRVLHVAIEQDRLLGDTAPNPVMGLANQFLNRTSEGDLSSVWLTADESRIQVSDRHGSTIPFASLGPADQHLVTLSLCLAGAKNISTEATISIDDVFANIDTSRVRATAQFLGELADQGQQIMAYTCRRGAIDTLQTMNNRSFTVLEMPETGVSTTPVVHPDRAPYVPPALPVEEYTHRPGPKFAESPALNTYPYLKYPVVGKANQTVLRQPAPFAENSIATPVSPVNPPQTISRPAPKTVSEVSTPRVVSEATRLSEFGSVNADMARELTSVGITTVGQLLDLDPDQLPAPLVGLGVTADQIDRWQAQLWMLICVPGMNLTDARVLVASGIQEPEQLDTTPYDQLVSRVSRYLESNNGRRDFSNYMFDRTRVDRWYDALRSTRSDWRRDTGYSRRYRRGQSSRQGYSQRSNSSDRGSRHSDRTDRNRSHGRDEAIRQYESHTRLRAVSEDRDRNSTRQPREPRERRSERRKKDRTTQSKVATTDKKLKFYLELTDHVEAAPSIGPKTAERFEKIGVVTIADFLRQTAESMASKIDYKRITANVVRQWQQHARLVCRIPNLRGHDAQLLVACGITDPQELADMSPDAVYGIVGPFSETKEGLKIIRSGKKPDLAEVKDWIDWASNHRTLQAA